MIFVYFYLFIFQAKSDVESPEIDMLAEIFSQAQFWTKILEKIHVDIM